jgi:hypothetical protein
MPSDDDTPKRVDIPTGGKTGIEIYRAVRAFLEKKAEQAGVKLHPSWYADGPEDLPELYGGQAKE